MKKAVLILILLILIAGAVGYFGWVRIEPGTFGIAHSSITGFIEEPVLSDRVNWYWQKLVPQSFTLYVVDNRPVTVDFSIEQSLPGSEQLVEYGTFDMTVSVSVRYSIDPSTARLLIGRGLLDGFEDHLATSLENEVGDLVSSFLVSTLGGTPRDVPENLETSEMLDALRSRIDGAVGSLMSQYELESAEWNIRFTEIPQTGVYAEAMMSYREYLAETADLQQEKLRRQSARDVELDEESLEVEKLQMYGELIERYPHLLKYIYIQKLGDRIEVILLPENRETGFPEFLDMTEAPSEREPRESVEPSPEPEASRDVPDTAEEEQADADVSAGDGGAGETAGKKWYEYLKFWEYFGSGDE